ncbi:MAG: TauD/TfdA family dioxygenase [Hormoscilla sp. GUM202]|nr:TauD/TfdA family dioxygenase [Hormoscilla sp. GUM202]
MTTYQKVNRDREIRSRQNERFINVAGKRFHYTWLRDNCLNSKYRDPESWEKLDDISDRPSCPEPLSVEERDGELIIDWNETPSHRSIFPISWLLKHNCDPSPAPLNEPVVLWDKAWLEANPVEKYDTRSSTPESWMSQLFKLGFVILSNIAPEDLDEFVTSFGPVRNTEYGGIMTQTVAKDLAASTHGLPPHTDLTFWYGHRVAEFIYCVKHEAAGGQTLIADSFRVTKDFQEQQPDYFKILSETPVQFWRVQHEHQYFFRPVRPILELGDRGEVAAVRFSYKNCTPILPFDKIEGFYEAYRAFSSYLNNPDYQYRFRFESGDCLLVQNFRVLHGRTAFDPASGPREMKVAYIEWDYFQARYFYQREFNGKFIHQS